MMAIHFGNKALNFRTLLACGLSSLAVASCHSEVLDNRGRLGNEESKEVEGAPTSEEVASRRPSPARTENSPPDDSDNARYHRLVDPMTLAPITVQYMLNGEFIQPKKVVGDFLCEKGSNSTFTDAGEVILTTPSCYLVVYELQIEGANYVLSVARELASALYRKEVPVEFASPGLSPLTVRVKQPKQNNAAADPDGILVVIE